MLDVQPVRPVDEKGENDDDGQYRWPGVDAR